ncbi:uncharacterized protein LOC114845009 isoform X1 [Betta splendens]|uniref:Uncharacterized protein LOC114845009 isoform X1 n=1 Tax=Betta splendens TaxID=158456 RepID=A0A9W2XDW1_BETSP|nr:uncharacterized protein LOC114845009 isoform X1 [Betta splendens]
MPLVKARVMDELGHYAIQQAEDRMLAAREPTHLQFRRAGVGPKPPTQSPPQSCSSHRDSTRGQSGPLWVNAVRPMRTRGKHSPRREGRPERVEPEDPRSLRNPPGDAPAPRVGPTPIHSGMKEVTHECISIMEHVFNQSLKLRVVPRLWKTSCVVPVPKTTHPKDLNNFRPVALTPHLMKTLERLVLHQLRCMVSSAMDLLQFAYQSGIGVKDAIIFLLHRSLAHLGKPDSTVRILFFDFSSAFNTIQPALLRDKLESAGVDSYLTVDTGPPHKPSQVCEGLGLRVGHSDLQCGSPTGDCPGPLRLHPLHCRLQTQLIWLCSAEVL